MRTLVEGRVIWIPLVDLITEKSILAKARKWLSLNLPTDDICEREFQSKAKKNKKVKLVCVKSTSTKIVGMYTRHVTSGGDFRAKWADLPDTPFFDNDTKTEIAWKNLYKWSLKDHSMNGSIPKKKVLEMRNVLIHLDNVTGNTNSNEHYTYQQAVDFLKNKC